MSKFTEYLDTNMFVKLLYMFLNFTSLDVSVVLELGLVKSINQHNEINVQSTAKVHGFRTLLYLLTVFLWTDLAYGKNSIKTLVHLRMSKRALPYPNYPRIQLLVYEVNIVSQWTFPADSALHIMIKGTFNQARQINYY